MQDELHMQVWLSPEFENTFRGRHNAAAKAIGIAVVGACQKKYKEHVPTGAIVVKANMQVLNIVGNFRIVADFDKRTMTIGFADDPDLQEGFDIVQDTERQMGIGS